MASVSPDLSLFLGPHFVPATIDDFLRGLSSTRNPSEAVKKLRDYIQGLEAELRKIEAFKRELPLCFLLVNDVISVLKDEATRWRKRQPVLEGFIPLKKHQHHDLGVERVEEAACKTGWIGSMKLGSDDIHSHHHDHHHHQQQHSSDAEKKRIAYSYSFLQKKGEEDGAGGPCTLTSGLKSVGEGMHSGSLAFKTSCSRSSSPVPVSQFSLRLSSHEEHQSSRKQRRCWSPDLHRRFVGALEKLGGSKVATPKQIRELMEIDGLTNDEVKSHLQKYRLNNQRSPSSTVVMIPKNSNAWVMSDHPNDCSKRSSSSPQGPLQLSINGGMSTTCCDSVDDEDERSETNGSV